MLGPLRSTLRAIFGRTRWERDLDDELRSHLEHRAADLIRAGHSPRDAERQARLELGSGETYREECRRSYGLLWLDVLGQDLRYAVRALRRSPGFTAVAVLSLALGIGANTAVFGVLDALVLRPLPVRSPEELVFVEPATHSFPYYRDLRDRNVTLAGLIAYRASPVGLGTGDAASRGWAYLATGNYFDVLGVKPFLGRTFTRDEYGDRAKAFTAVISYRLWQEYFRGDPSILGRAVRINRHQVTIVGVAPPEFRGDFPGTAMDGWIPVPLTGESRRDARNFQAIVRLKPGVSISEANAEAATVAARLARAYPKTNQGVSARIVPIWKAQEGASGVLASPMAILGAACGLVLLIACANVTNLLLARSASRRREFGIRAALGAGPGRLSRQQDADILAFMLSANRFPVGKAELERETEVLKLIKIEQSRER